jgi:amino acid permease
LSCIAKSCAFFKRITQHFFCSIFFKKILLVCYLRLCQSAAEALNGDVAEDKDELDDDSDDEDEDEDEDEEEEEEEEEEKASSAKKLWRFIIT